MNLRITKKQLAVGLLSAIFFVPIVPAWGNESPPPAGAGLEGLYRSVRNGRGKPAASDSRGEGRTSSRELPPLYPPYKRARERSPRPIQTEPTARLLPPVERPTFQPERAAPTVTPAPERESAADTRSARVASLERIPRPPAREEKQEPAPEKSKTERLPGPGFPTTLTPTAKGGYRYRAPKYYEGIYITNPIAKTRKRYEPLLRRAKEHGINTLVVDVQPSLPDLRFIRMARENGFYMVARVVVFPGGLNRYPPPMGRVQKVLGLAEEAARTGFMEIQLDYIRFADRIKGQKNVKLSLRKRYRLIEGILKMATDRLRPHGVRVGADIFGRIPFNQNDIIGQQVELFAAHMDTLYPMLYPSHFYGEPSRIRDPYRTILEGNRLATQRARGEAKSIAYIQGFKMSVGPSGLSYENYIRKQLVGAADSGGAGYVVWNARNRYGPFFRALARHRKIQASRDARTKDKGP